MINLQNDVCILHYNKGMNFQSSGDSINYRVITTVHLMTLLVKCKNLISDILKKSSLRAPSAN
jgi:hypothetical protein